MSTLHAQGPEAALWLTVDVLGSLALLAAACLAAGVAFVRPRRMLPFWFGAAGGLLYLAADERFSLHERAGRWLQARQVEAPPGLNHLDDAVLLAVVAGAALWVLVFWREVLVSRRFAALL